MHVQDKPLSMFLEPPIAYLQSEKRYADSRTSMAAICMGSNLMSIGCSNAYLVDQNEIGNEEANVHCPTITSSSFGL
jgi:hypothetical protein